MSHHDLEAQVSGYHRDGFVVLPELLTPAECAALKTEARALLDGPDADKVWRTPSVLVGAAVVSPLFRRLASDPRLLPLLWAIYPQGPMFLSDKIVFKSKEQRFASPWHADIAYWRGTRPKISVWIALDDVSAENGALKVVPGSHLREWEHDHGHVAGGKDEFVFTTKVAWKPEDELICAMKRGGVIVFTDRLIHASTENTAGLDRYSLISTYHAVGADEPFDIANCPARHALPRPEAVTA